MEKINLAEYVKEALAQGKTVNKGIDYSFNGSISLEVLNNYLNRTITYCTYPDGQNFGKPYINEEYAAECIRGILSVGAKFVTRFFTEWTYSKGCEAGHEAMKALMAEVHEIDPDIVFEACIFETCGTGDSLIEIPAHVFEAFGLPYEKRNFDYEKMVFDDGFGKSRWAAAWHVPDVTKLETQMFFYYRGCRYIDLGIESIHFGQTNLMGRNEKDINFPCYTKVINMIREYAKTHARRGYIITNSHSSKFIGTDGINLLDFHGSPIRLRTAKGETDHAASETTPQFCDFYPGEDMLYGTKMHPQDAPYLKHIKATNYSGWTSEDYPYLLEYDNWGGRNNRNFVDNVCCIDRFNYDEISWLVNQPDWFRRVFMRYAVVKVEALKDNGHISMPGRRTSLNLAENVMRDYSMNRKSAACPEGRDDEDTIRDIWKNLK